MKHLLIVGLLTVGLAGCGGCGQSEEERRAQELEEAAEELSDAAEEMSEAAGGQMGEAMENFAEALGGAMGAGSNSEDYEPVERQVLRDLVPERMGGMTRTSIESARDGAMGMTVTRAEAEFEGEEGRFEFKITDLAGVPMAGMLGAAWTMAEIDRESDTEVERTMTYRGHRGYEKYNSSSNSGELSVIVNGFLVEGRGRNMSREQIQAAMNDAPLAQLERAR